MAGVLASSHEGLDEPTSKAATKTSGFSIRSIAIRAAERKALQICFGGSNCT